MKIKRTLIKLSLLIAGSALLACGLFVAAWLLFPFPHRRIEQYPASTQILDRNGRCMRIVLGNEDIRCQPVVLEKTGQWTRKALIASEDKRFHDHHGIDVLAVVRALKNNLQPGRLLSGASTLSTQLIRLSNPRPRTISTKCIEAFRALQLESQYDKQDILEQYLNRAPFGSNLTGIESASQYYFGKHAEDLTLAEASLLVGLVQSPSRYRPDRHLIRALNRREYVLKRMQNLGFISNEQRITAEQQPITATQHPVPFLAPHFCDFILQSGRAVSGTSNAVIHTTLNPRHQHIANQVLKQYAAQYRLQQVFGGAVVVISVKTGEVTAMAGSPAYFDEIHAGQVNGAIAPRSPGSALKPFVYALGFDRGILTPGSVIGDVPRQFDTYTPENYTRTFSGLVSVRSALIDSLNIPALTAVEHVSRESFYSCLHDLGLDSLDKPDSHYGISLVLGSAEVSLLNLANAYACLAREGTWLPYRLTEGQNTGTPHTVFSPEAAWMVSDILSGAERVIAESGHSADVKVPRIAWKTGTSTGHRDAWTIAWNPEFVVAVWIGNPDGSPADILNGTGAAAPVAHEIFRQLYPSGNSPWFTRPADIAERTVCSRSGQPAGQCCPETDTAWYIKGVSDPAPCTVHQSRSSAVTTSPIDSITRTSLKVVEIWPPHITAYLQNSHNKTEERTQNTPVLQIEHPVHGSSYCLLDEDNSLNQALQLTASGGDNRYFWFIDNAFIGSCLRNERIPWQLSKGKHIIACSDTTGHSARSVITVE